jgi:hypothetical protein
MIRDEIKNLRRLEALTIETADMIENLHSASQIQIAKAWLPLDGEKHKASNYRNSIT